MAVTGTITKTKQAYGTTELTITGVLQGSTSPSFLSEGLPFGSAMVAVAGTAPTSVALQGSNDNTNFVQLGSLATAFPAATPLSTLLAACPMKFYNFNVVGGDATTLITITIILMGTRG